MVLETMLLSLMAAQAGLGALGGYKNYEQKKSLADEQKELNKYRSKWQGFTGDRPVAVGSPDALSNIISGALGGFSGGVENVAELSKTNMLSKLADDSGTPKNVSSGEKATPDVSSSQWAAAQPISRAPQSVTPSNLPQQGVLSSITLPTNNPLQQNQQQPQNDMQKMFLLNMLLGNKRGN